MVDKLSLNVFGTFVKEGTWLGDFGSSQKIGFEIITQKESLTLNLGYLRSAKHQIDVGGLTGLALRKKREEVLSFRDPAAFFGIHYKTGVKTSTYDSSGNKSTQTYKEQALYDLLLKDKFATCNRVYVDIRSERGLSYNFYQNYGDSAGNNLKLGNSQTVATAQQYERQSWPLLMLEEALETASDNNDLKLNLRVDDNTNPLLYLENTALLGTNNRARFLADSQLLDTGAWTQDINLQFPNVAGTGSSKLNMPFYIKLAYGRQDFNPVAPKNVPHSEDYFNNAFCPLNLPNLGNVNDTFQRLQNPTKHFLKGQLAGADFAYVAENGAYWDNDRILFYAQASHSYQSTGKFYSSTGIEHKLSLASQSFQSSFLNKNLNISCQLYEEEVSTGQYEPFKSIAMGAYTGVPNFQENLLLLGITLSELEDLKLVADSVLSAEHPQYLFLEEETDSPKIDKEGRTFQKFILKLQGLKPNGEQESVTSVIPTAVYARDGFCFTSKSFAEKEEIRQQMVAVAPIETCNKLGISNPLTNALSVNFMWSVDVDFVSFGTVTPQTFVNNLSQDLQTVWNTFRLVNPPNPPTPLNLNNVTFQPNPTGQMFVVPPSTQPGQVNIPLIVGNGQNAVPPQNATRVSYVGYGPNPNAHVYINQTSGNRLTMAHEFGHVFGLKDRYAEVFMAYPGQKGTEQKRVGNAFDTPPRFLYRQQDWDPPVAGKPRTVTVRTCGTTPGNLIRWISNTDSVPDRTTIPLLLTQIRNSQPLTEGNYNPYTNLMAGINGPGFNTPPGNLQAFLTATPVTLTPAQVMTVLNPTACEEDILTVMLIANRPTGSTFGSSYISHDAYLRSLANPNVAVQTYPTSGAQVAAGGFDCIDVQLTNLPPGMPPNKQQIRRSLRRNQDITVSPYITTQAGVPRLVTRSFALNWIFSQTLFAQGGQGANWLPNLFRGRNRNQWGNYRQEWINLTPVSKFSR